MMGSKERYFHERMMCHQSPVRENGGSRLGSSKTGHSTSAIFFWYAKNFRIDFLGAPGSAQNCAIVFSRSGYTDILVLPHRNKTVGESGTNSTGSLYFDFHFVNSCSFPKPEKSVAPASKCKPFFSKKVSIVTKLCTCYRKRPNNGRKFENRFFDFLAMQVIKIRVSYLLINRIPHIPKKE